MKTCTVSECTRQHAAQGFCLPHYKRWKKYGHPLGSAPRPSSEERFWKKVEVTGPDECWPWTKGCIGGGYGAFHPVKGELVLAHRFAFELVNGTLATGDEVDHTCHNGTDCAGGPTCEHRKCCNPAHLEAVSPDENKRRSHRWNGNKTSCPAGHRYTNDNTYINPTRGIRICRACARNRDGQRRSKGQVQA